MIETLGRFSAALAVITQAVKGFTYDKIPTRVIAFITAVVLCVATMCASCAVENVAITWYYVACAIVGGFVAAYAAMYERISIKLDCKNLRFIALFNTH